MSLTKTKIALMVQHDISEVNGFTARARRTLEILRTRCDVTLIMRANKKPELEHIENSSIMLVKPKRTRLWALKLIPILVKNKFDYVFCLNDWFGFITCYLLSKIYNYKIIFESTISVPLRNRIFYESRWLVVIVNLFQFLLEKFVIKHANYVLALSGITFEFYKKYNKNVYLHPLFVDEEVFKKNKEVDRYKSKKDSKLVGLIGPFDVRFNKDYLDFLYDNLDKLNSRINFVIIGKCDKKIKNRRIIYANYLDSIKDYVDWLSRLDAVLVYKLLDLGPHTKVIESMSCSLPVFAAPTSMIGLEYAVPGRDILIFEKEELIDQINSLIFNDELMDEIGRNARIAVERYYGKKANEKKLIDILESMDI